MAYKLIASSKSELDIAKAIEHYKAIRVELAREFLIELRATSKYIQKNPKKLQIRYINVRAAFLKRFPYAVHYRLEGKTISILAVFHTSEDSDKWEE